MLRSRVLFGLLLASMVGVMSCTSGEDGLSGPSMPEPAALTSSGGGLLFCKPLPYASASRAIGPAGGTILVGPHKLVVPAGALASTVTISAEAPVSDVNSVKLLPEGLKFAAGKPAKLTLSYANCSIVSQLLPKRIAYTTDLLQILSYVLSVDDPLNKRVTGSLEHFSKYAVAW